MLDHGHGREAPPKATASFAKQAQLTRTEIHFQNQHLLAAPLGAANCTTKLSYKFDAQDFETSPWGAAGRSLTLGVVSLASQFVLKVLNRTTVRNADSWIRATTQRDPDLGLITVSNHTSTIDDPTLHCAMLPAGFFFTEHRHLRTRWVTCAEDMCFRNAFLRQFFMSGKTLPVKRGGGVHQPVMAKLSEFGKRGDWIHVFPEGKVSYSGRLQSLKWGVGKLVCDSLKDDGTPPMVVPFYHSGMGDVMPRRGRVPRLLNDVTILVGDPLELRHVTCRCRGDAPQRAWSDITAEIEKALKKLEEMSPSNRNQIPS